MWCGVQAISHEQRESEMVEGTQGNTLLSIVWGLYSCIVGGGHAVPTTVVGVLYAHQRP